jgi:hypothetical protein
MKSFLEPWHLLLLILAGWINHRQQDAVEYLRTENQILKEKLGKKRILLDDDQRRRLAVKGKILTEDAARGCHYRNSGYDPALASGIGGCQMELQWATQQDRAAAHSRRDC